MEPTLTSTSLELERLERKVDMSLDDIIKMQKKIQRKKRKTIRKVKRKSTFQDSVSLPRSTTIQQGRIAKSRLLIRDFCIVAPNTSQKILYRDNGTKMKKRNRKRSNKNNSAPGGTAPNIKVLASHDLRRRFLSGTRKGGIATRLSSGFEKVDSTGPQGNSQTLDSRFASISRGRQVPSGGMYWR